MREREEISELIGMFYDATLAPEIWPSALAGVCAFVRGSAAMVFWQNRALRNDWRVFSWGGNPEYSQSYFNVYIKTSPIFTLQHLTPVGEVFSVRERIAFNELQSTRFYKEWLVPQGYCDNIFALLDRSATSNAAIAVARSAAAGFADDACRRRMRAIVPHVRRAALIASLLDQVNARGAELQVLLDSLTAGIFLLDADAKVLQANAAGLALLKHPRAPLHQAERFGSDDMRFDREVRAFCTRAAVSGDSIGVSGLAVALHDETGDRTSIARLLPLRGGAQSLLETKGAVAALFIAPVGAPLDAPLALAADHYKLTRRESEVLQGVLEVGAVPEVAANLGLAQRTVKTHLHRVFDKTGVRRQVDLAKLVAGMASPGIIGAAEAGMRPIPGRPPPPPTPPLC